ncbi:MAG: hypothetical protein K2X50_10110 [Gammaproteobacteria bacterium]|nr:hypothetical protein [Gammaproteobacteria bacterium]
MRCRLVVTVVSFFLAFCLSVSLAQKLQDRSTVSPISISINNDNNSLPKESLSSNVDKYGNIILSFFTFLLVVVGGVHILVMISANKKESRAYIGVTGFKLNCKKLKEVESKPLELKPGDLIQDNIVVFVKNGGKTPARILNSHCSMQSFSFGYLLPKDFSYLDINTFEQNNIGPMNSQIVLLPGEITWYNFPVDLNEIKKARNKEISLYCYGHIDYLDIFKKPRITNFCALLVFPDENEADVSFIFFNKHNDYS